MIHVLFVRVLYPGQFEQMALKNLLEASGLNMHDAKVTDLPHRALRADDNREILQRVELLGLTPSPKKPSLVVVAFLAGDSKVHLIDLFRSLEVLKVPMFPPVGVVFEPDWKLFAHQHGSSLTSRFVRLPYQVPGAGFERVIHVIPLLSQFQAIDAEYLGYHLGLIREKPRLSDADETQKIEIERPGTGPHDRPTVAPPPPKPNNDPQR